MKEYREGMIVSLGKVKIERIAGKYIDFQVVNFIDKCPIIRIDRKAFDKYWLKKQRIQQRKTRERKKVENSS